MGCVDVCCDVVLSLMHAELRLVLQAIAHEASSNAS
jgi:hypothetical protein